MMGKFKKYEKYQDSGLEWLGEIPTHWEVRPFKTFTDFINRGTPPKYSIESTAIKVVNQATFSKGYWDEKNIRFHYKGKGERGILYIGDILLASTGGGVLGKTSIFNIKENGFKYMADSHVTIIRDSKKRINSYFYYYYFSTKFDLINAVLAQGSTNQTEIQKEWLRSFKLPFPPKEEQNCIANFLDEKTKQIDNFIQLKEKTIVLLQERKAAIINQAVTKGLDPNVPMKDSGIEWLGDIPEHWEVKKLKHLGGKIEQGWSPLCDDRLCESEMDVGVTKVGVVNDIKFLPFEHKLLPKNLKPRTQYLLKEGDFLISRANTKELIALAAIVPKLNFKLLLCDKLYRLDLDDKKINKLFLLYAIRSSYSRKQIETKCTGASSSMQNISQGSIKEILITSPKDLKEQIAIKEFINTVSIKIDESISQSKKEITLIKEYRASLISAAVTGKIDVRDYQKRGAKTEVSSVEST